MGKELKKIICVDDDTDILKISKITLENIGKFEVFTFTSGKELLENIANIDPDIILLDVMMPELDGVAVLKELRRRTIATPVIFVTAKIQQNEVNEYIAAGALGVIKKPFDPVNLPKEILALWDKLQLLDVSTVDNEIQNLVQQYIEHLKEYKQEITKAIEICKDKKLTAQYGQYIQESAHKLIGSGATYGFKDLSDAARKVETELNNKTEIDYQKLITLLENLANACTKAIAKNSEEPVKINREEIVTKLPAIIVADDDPESVKQFRTILANSINVFLALNREEIFNFLEKEKPDFVIINPELKEINAIRFIESLQIIPAYSNTKVIMLIHENKYKETLHFIMAGAVDYITKPINAVDINEKILMKIKRKNTTIMIVDDDQEIRDLLFHKFKNAGCRVLLAENGHQALKLTSTDIPDLILLDYMMPGLDGGAVLQKMRKNISLTHVPILYLTAKKQEADILQGFKLGAADYITKPFIPEEVIARCFRLLNMNSKNLNER